LVLGLIVTSLAAIGAVILAVFGQAHGVIGLAQRAVLDATALLFGQIADQAFEFFVSHLRASLCSIFPLRRGKIKPTVVLSVVGPEKIVVPGR
jgi:hypothetical protein